MMKKLVAVVTLAMLVTLSVAGCSTNTTNTASVSPSTTQGHDVVLSTIVQAIHDAPPGNGTLVDWKVTWRNDTTVTINSSTKGVSLGSQNYTLFSNRTFYRFSSNDDATEFVGSYNITGFALVSTNYTAGGPYENATGHAPTLYRDYQKILSNKPTIDVIQLDNYVEIRSSTSALE